VWLGTAALSVVAHGVGLALLAVLLGSGAMRSSRSSLGLASFPVDDASMFVDVTAEPEVSPNLTGQALEPSSAARPLPVRLGTEADRLQPAARPAPSAPVAVSPARQGLPSSDTGDSAGQRLLEPAWRRDSSTLHERLTDGAHTYQPSRELTSPRTRPASPQAVRREQARGVGDSARTRRPAPPLATANYPAPPTRDDQPGGETRDGQMTNDDAEPSVAETPRPVAVAASAAGPLDAELGPRSFDAAGRLPRVADDESTRAASAELRPGVTDFSLASLSGTSARGSGPSDVPGAIPTVSPGDAPSPKGVRGVKGGRGDEESLRERTYDRYEQEVRRRVGRAQVFPKDLALRLEQGQTLLRFVLRSDGRLVEAARIVKSSGFAEFDQAALDAVRQAMPFPAMPDPRHAGPRAFNMLVEFTNPVIR
jgi:TonB family protein